MFCSFHNEARNLWNKPDTPIKQPFSAKIYQFELGNFGCANTNALSDNWRQIQSDISPFPHPLPLSQSVAKVLHFRWACGIPHTSALLLCRTPPGYRLHLC
jgi:hypothetical protein